MTRKKILVVEDEQDIVDVVEYVLEEHGFDVVSANDGDHGLEMFRSRRPELVVLDLGLPGISGLDLFNMMRKERSRIPVIMLTSRTDEVDRVTGLELGADDYVTKPFSPRELVARVRSVLRRVDSSAEVDEKEISVGPLTVWPDDFRTTYFGREVQLSRQEFRLLQSLVRHPARVYTRDALIDVIYDGEAIVTDRSIDAQVKRIRKKCQQVRPEYDPIQTVYGIGYKLNQELEELR